jgi:hypothetical protein
MAWLVFGLFFLASDHAPRWVYAAFIIGYLVDSWREAAASRAEAQRHHELMMTLETTL